MERLLRLLHKRGHWYALGLVVAVALFSAAACSTALGITRVGITEREVMAGASFDGGSNEDFDYFVSVDGGETWRPTDALTDVQLTDVQWSEGPVDTPRGTFSIEGPDIVLTPPNGVADTVFSASDWRTSSNRWFQKSQTHDLRGRLLSKGPVAIAYDPASDNVIAAAGIMGAVVGTPDGQWTAVAVGNYSPLVFSRSAKLKTLLSQHVFWATVITFPLLMIALAFCFKDLAHKGFQTSKYEGRIDTTASPSHDLRPFTTSYLDYYDRRGLGLPLQTAAYRNLRLDAVSAISVIFLLMSFFSVVFMLVLGSGVNSDIWFWLPVAILVAVSVTASTLAWRGQWRVHWGGLAGSYLAMAVIVALPFLVWVQTGLPLAVPKTLASVLCLAIAVAIFLRLNNKPPSPSAQDEPTLEVDGEVDRLRP